MVSPVKHYLKHSFLLEDCCMNAKRVWGSLMATLAVFVLAAGCPTNDQQGTESIVGSSTPSSEAGDTAAEERSKAASDSGRPQLSVPDNWPQDVPLPAGVVTDSVESELNRSLSLTVRDTPFEDLVAMFAAMQQDGWVPLADNTVGQVNERLAQYTYNKGPRQAAISVVKDDAEPDATLVQMSLGKNPRFRE